MPSIQRIALATDLGHESEDLFAHALAISLRAQAALHLVHISEAEHPEASWRRLPTVRTLLERWGTLEPNAPQVDFERLNIRVTPKDYEPTDGDLTAAIARRVADLKPDLLVLGTHARTGFERLLMPSVAEPVARNVHRSTLFVSDRAKGFVDPATGQVRLSRVLVPITTDVPQQELIDELVVFLEGMRAGQVSFTFVHVGSDASLPTLNLPARADWMWKTDRRTGTVVEQILEAEVAHDVHLIAMATEGHTGFLDSIRGSTTERVLRRAQCPVLTVPVK